MEPLQLPVPDMYADHHVLKVRTVLDGQPGLQNVVASAAFRMVALEYDPRITSAAAITAALAEAGYPVANGSGEQRQAVPVANGRGDPAWDRLGVRISRTDARDAKGSR